MHNFTLLTLLVFLLCAFSVSSGFFFKSSRRPLPVDGGWSSWGPWNSCYKNTINSSHFFPQWTDFVVKSRPRFCDSPRPLNGGKYCQGTGHKFKQCDCKNPLGFQNGRIRDFQIKASSKYRNFTASKGRIGNPLAWCSGNRRSILSTIFFQVDFVNFTKVSSISTEGLKLGRVPARVRHFKLIYSLDGKKWHVYKDKLRRRGLFSANLFPGRVKINNLEKPFITRYVRIEPTRYYYRPCLKTEMFGCVFTCGSQLTASHGDIVGSSSELFDQNCIWNIKVPNTTIISLDFVTFDLPCEFGFVDIKGELDTVSGPANRQRYKRFCGDNVELEPYKFPGNNVWLHYFSNSSDAETGFRIKYHSLCRKELKLTSNQKTQISTPNYPEDYFHNTQCNWTISTVKGSKFFLAIIQFDIEKSNKNGEFCHNDFLRIYTITGGLTKRIGNYCNSNKPPKLLVLDTNTIMLQFKSDNVIAGKGFLIEISNYDPTKPTPTERLTAATISSIADQNRPELALKTTPADQNSGISPSALLPDSTKYASVIQIVKSVPKVSPGANNTFYNRKIKNGDDDNDDDTWTVVVLGSFGGVVLMLVIIVGVIKIRRYMQLQDALAMQATKYAKFTPSKKKEIAKTKDPGVKEVLLKPDKSNGEASGMCRDPEDSGVKEVLLKPDKSNGEASGMLRDSDELIIEREMSESPKPEVKLHDAVDQEEELDELNSESPKPDVKLQDLSDIVNNEEELDGLDSESPKQEVELQDLSDVVNNEKELKEHRKSYSLVIDICGSSERLNGDCNNESGDNETTI